MAEKNLNTPMMRQYMQFKAQYPQALLIMRVGDFYEAYGEDAVVVSRVLGIILTKRSGLVADSVELCGFPYHALDNYLPKLVRAGYKVAVCDQLENPKLAKTIVKRGVTELITPGVAYNEDVLDRNKNNYLAALYFYKDLCGIAFLDVSTGTFKVAQGSLDFIDVLLADFSPKEVLLQKGYVEGFKKHFSDKFYITVMDDWAFVEQACNTKLEEHFGQMAIKGFGIERLELAKVAAGTVLFYLQQNRASGLSSFDAVTIKGQSGTMHINSISRIDREEFVWLDKFTVRNLEIFETFSPDGISLLDIVDHTACAMGARLLRSWIAMPLLSVEKINNRYDAVEFFLSNSHLRKELHQRIESVGDMERIISRASAGKIVPRETLQLHRALAQMEPIAQMLEQSSLKEKIEGLNYFYRDREKYSELSNEIARVIRPEPAATFGKGPIIADGVDEELDSLRHLSTEGKEFLLSLQQSESERTGIPSLKISYNNVFGYYLEVRNTYKDRVPADWIRKQTLVSAERYITPQLKEYEEKILGAEERIIAIEQRLYLELVAKIQQNISVVQLCCNAIAQIDILVGFAILAKENKYCRPIVDNSLNISIKQGRHPVLETTVGVDKEYVANDLFLDNKENQIIILTGPNMSGKSALLRQTALIVLLAQCGCYIPAKEATIGVVDKIFTRVGASDNISKGESTFMVEMLETAAILHNLSERSLVLLDEIGRGTSTFDGMSIAWSIVEFLQGCGLAPKTIFATHYHELNELEKLYPSVNNFHIEVKEAGSEIIFLHKLKPGGVAHSFGIHVARLAGMPELVLHKAEIKLKELEKGKNGKRQSVGNQEEENSMQLSLFQLDDPTLSALRKKLEAADMNSMTPLQAFDLLRDMKKELGLS